MSTESMSHPVEPKVISDFAELYQSLNKDNLHRLSEVYSDDVVFIDSSHKLQGISNLTDYFEGLYSNLEYCKFDIKHIQSDSTGHAFLTWQMDFAHPKLSGGKNITVDGATDLRFEEKITYHRDFIDMGQMLYEHIPVLGSVIRFIKKKAIS